MALGLQKSIKIALPQSNQRCRYQRTKVQAVVQEASKKDVRKPRTENDGLTQKGAFFVDHTCIGTCLLVICHSSSTIRASVRACSSFALRSVVPL